MTLQFRESCCSAIAPGSLGHSGDRRRTAPLSTASVPHRLRVRLRFGHPGSPYQYHLLRFTDGKADALTAAACGHAKFDQIVRVSTGVCGGTPAMSVCEKSLP